MSGVTDWSGFATHFDGFGITDTSGVNANRIKASQTAHQSSVFHSPDSLLFEASINFPLLKKGLRRVTLTLEDAYKLALEIRRSWAPRDASFFPVSLDIYSHSFPRHGTVNPLSNEIGCYMHAPGRGPSRRGSICGLLKTSYNTILACWKGKDDARAMTWCPVNSRGLLRTEILR
jgi:hypothetical protein